MKLPTNYENLTQNGRRAARTQYVKQQNGLCHYCKSPLEEPVPDAILAKKINWKKFPEGFLKYPIHLHHNHFTVMTIGAVHAYCNAILWVYHDE
jgi:hypothetical protein